MENSNNSYFKQFESGKGIEFMDHRAKGDIQSLLGRELHVDDFGFINGTHGKYVAVIFKEEPEFFYFGGIVLTDILTKVDADNQKEALREQTIRLGMKKSRNGRNTYMTVEFI